MSSSQKAIHPLHSQSTKFENLEMRRMSMSRLQNLSPNWRQKQHEQPLGIPGHKKPSLLHRRCGWHPGRCLSQKCSSSKLQPVPGRRESNMEVDQGWHLWDLMKYKWDTTLSFRLRVSKQQFPLDSRQMWFTEVHFQPISCQYPSRKHTTSYHTEWVQVKKQFTHFAHSQLNLKTWKCEGWAWADYKTFQAGDKDTMSSHLESRERPERPHRQWNWPTIWCLSRKRSSSKLQLVPGQRESDMEVDQSWHLWDLMKYKGDRTLSFRLRVSKEQIPLDSGQMSFTEIHFQPISCQYTSRKHTTSYHAECIQFKNQFTHFTDSQQDLEPGNAKDEHEQTTKPFTKLATKTPWAATCNPGTQKAFTPSSPMELATGRCLSQKCSSSKLQLVPGQRESDMDLEVDQGWHPWDLVKYKREHNSQFPTLSFQRETSTGFRSNVVYSDTFPANIMPISQ